MHRALLLAAGLVLHSHPSAEPDPPPKPAFRNCTETWVVEYESVSVTCPYGDRKCPGNLVDEEHPMSPMERMLHDARPLRSAMLWNVAMPVGKRKVVSCRAAGTKVSAAQGDVLKPWEAELSR
ncbi:MAG: hypothetical protein R3B13_15405 [Polyangiaceae bacterium]